MRNYERILIRMNFSTAMTFAWWHLTPRRAGPGLEGVRERSVSGVELLEGLSLLLLEALPERDEFDRKSKVLILERNLLSDDLRG